MFTVWDKGRNAKVQADKIVENTDFKKSERSNGEDQYINFLLKIYQADGIAQLDAGIMTQVRKTFSVDAGELLDPYVEAFYGGLKGTTAKKKRTTTPSWNQQIVFTLKFPIPSEPLVIQIRDDEIMINNVVGTAVIHMDKISNSDSGGFLPTFGPCYVYLSESRNVTTNESDNVFRGRLLMSLSTEIITNPTLSKPYVVVESTAPLPQGTCGQEVDFLLFACIRDATMIEKKVAEKPLRFTLQIGHIPEYTGGKSLCVSLWATGTDVSRKSSWIDSLNGRESSEPNNQSEYCSSFITPVTTNRKYYNIPIREKKECLWLKSSWPDYSRRMYISNILDKATQQMETSLRSLYEYADIKNSDINGNVDAILRNLENTITYFLKLLKENWGILSSKTQLDKERWKIYEKILEDVCEVAISHRQEEDRAATDIVAAKVEKLLLDLKNIKDDPQPALPDVRVWMENNQKRIGYFKIAARDLLYAASDVERGVHCGKIRSIFFRPLSKRKNTLYLAKLDVYIWLGLQKHFKHCLQGLPEGFDSDLNGKEVGHIDYIPRAIHYYEKQTYEVLVHIYQARLLPWSDMSKFPNPVTQLFMGDKCLSTQIREDTLNPIWDETLVFSNLIFFGSKREIAVYSPDIVVEIFNHNPLGRSTSLCRGVIPVLRNDSNYPPLLEWHSMTYFDPEETTQILAAFELVLMPDAGGDAGMFERKFDDIGPAMSIPESIRPRFSLHRIEVLFWGLRELKRVKFAQVEAPRIEMECAGNIIQSSVITNYERHSNFVKMIEVIDVELPERECYFPALTIRLLDCKSFGWRNILASHVIHKLKKYVMRPRGELLKPKFEEKKPSRGTLPGLGDIVIGMESSDEETVDDKYIHHQEVHIPWTKSFAPEEDEEEDLDWWSRYYISSMEMPQNKRSSVQFMRRSMTGRRSTFGFVDSRRLSQRKMSVISHYQKVIEEFGNGVFRAAGDDLDALGFIIYPCELENVPEFGGFKEWLHSFELTRGRTFARFYGDAEKTIAIFKGCFRIYEVPLPTFVMDPLLPFSNNSEGLFYGLPDNEPTIVIVRVYIVEAFDLAPSDATNTADPYIVINMGQYSRSEKDDYVSKQLNPVFGKCIELVANFPRDSMLHIQVMDWDLMGVDDLIGETKIDLENRFYSRHRPTCGLTRTYETSGPNAWRDVCTPVEILENLCQENGLGTPQITGKDVRIANIVYDFGSEWQDDEASKQNMALYLLHRWKDIAPGKYSLVPEHLETRTLHHPAIPGESRGKLVMWIDMFPEDSVPPFPSRDISKRKPIGYELRVIIWNTEEVTLSDDAFFTGEKMSDIYVKGCLSGKEDSQRTDVHYRSLTGEGNFNWRFVFPFNYLPVERKMVVMKKVARYSWDETEHKLPPMLKLQIFDADHFKADDFLGEIILDLRQFPRGAKSTDKCNLEIHQTAPQVSLFKQRRIRGWWPVSLETSIGDRELTVSYLVPIKLMHGNQKWAVYEGKLEAELHLLSKEEAEQSPVGLGRKEPDALSEPKRPETSFINFLHPLKTFRYAFWKRYKKTAIKVIILAALTLVLLLFFYAAPGYTAKKLIGA